MDLLKKYIKKNREQFDDLEPQDGHFERFAARLSDEKQHKKPMQKVLLAAISIAAAVALVLLYIVPFGHSNDGTCVLPNEVAEVNSYYLMKREIEIDKVQSLAQQLDPTTKTELLTVIMDMRNQANSILKTLCSTGASESDSIQIVRQLYETQIEALQNAITTVEQKKLA